MPLTLLKKNAIALYGWCRLFLLPAHWGVVRRHLFPPKPSPHPDADHLRATIDWLCRAQDVTGDGGASAGYFCRRGWVHPYPETTGYIIPTFLRYAARQRDDAYLERARRMGAWEIDIQLPSGAVRGGRGRIGDRPYPIVFNTGQVLLGWAALYRTTGEERFLEAAEGASDWLLQVQDDDGKWSRHTYMDVPHAYHTRVAWPLLEIHALTGVERYRAAARRHVEWSLNQAGPSGWLPHMELVPGEDPPTHTIAYTLRGLLEISAHLEELRQPILEIVLRASDHLLQALSDAPPAGLPATFDADWRPTSSGSCPTGNAQLAILWLELYRQQRDPRFADAAISLLEGIKATQSLDARHPGIRGGIAGSTPIWGPYIPYAYPNWAAKFFADALMKKEEIQL